MQPKGKYLNRGMNGRFKRNFIIKTPVAQSPDVMHLHEFIF